MFEGLQSELLRSASVRWCYQSWNGSCVIFLDAFTDTLGAPDWEQYSRIRRT